jgi:hypothetical protein
MVQYVCVCVCVCTYRDSIFSTSYNVRMLFYCLYGAILDLQKESPLLLGGETCSRLLVCRQ